MRIIGRHKTKVSELNGTTIVKYHNTAVVMFDKDMIILHSGGWDKGGTGGWSGNYRPSYSTKARMNQTSSQFDLGYQVFQRDWIWYVSFKGKTIPFYDGMELKRN